MANNEGIDDFEASIDSTVPLEEWLSSKSTAQPEEEDQFMVNDLFGSSQTRSPPEDLAASIEIPDSQIASSSQNFSSSQVSSSSQDLSSPEITSSSKKHSGSHISSSFQAPSFTRKSATSIETRDSQVTLSSQISSFTQMSSQKSSSLELSSTSKMPSNSQVASSSQAPPSSQNSSSPEIPSSSNRANSKMSSSSRNIDERRGRSLFRESDYIPQGSTTIKEENDVDEHMHGTEITIQSSPKAATDGSSNITDESPVGAAQPVATDGHATKPPSPIHSTTPNGNQSRSGIDDDLITQPASLTIEPDDDLVEIVPSRASPNAQRRWQQQSDERNNPIDVDNNNGGTNVVKEKINEAAPAPVQPPIQRKSKPSIHEILAAQKALLLRSKEAGEDVGSRSPRRNSNGEGSSLHPNSRKRQFDDTQLGEDRMLVDSVMRDGEEDHSWMDEEPEDGDSEYNSLCTQRDILMRRERNGKVTSAESLELFKLNSRIQHMDRLKVAANRVDEDEDSLFIADESREDVVQRHRRNIPRRNNAGSDVESDFGSGANVFDGEEAFLRMMQQELDGDDDNDVEVQLTKAGKPRKRKGKQPKNAREYHEKMEAQRAATRAKAQKKKGRGGSRAEAASKKNPPAKGKAAKAAKKGKEKSSKKKGSGSGSGSGAITNGKSLLSTGKFAKYDCRDDVGQMILEDLMNNDPINDRLNNPVFKVGAEPSMPGKHVKATQFSMLFANIPEGSSRKTALNDKKQLQEASKSFGYAKVKAQDGKWLIKGMKSTLYHHQLLGAQWMVKRELSSNAPHGGLLADSMGLGKTVQTLACMVGNPPGPEDVKRGVKATLIVVPAGVLNQWFDEIKYHASEKIFPKVMIYKSAMHIPMSVLQDLDIVLCGYGDVMKQFPFPDKSARETISEIGYKAWWKQAICALGPLHQVNWFRVVLDEAQAIKNNSARTSLACQNLKSVYRWCLTGTPLLNRLEELFPYLRFLKANYSIDWQTFQKYFCDPDADDCYNRISTLLSYTMMRRTMKTTILNRPIITLPPPHPEILYVQFSQEEQIIYRITENRFRSNLNTFFAKDQAQRAYGVFMVQLLRLRQCTSHPFMLERTIKESWTLEDVSELKAKLSRLSGGGDAMSRKPFYEQCKVWVEQSEKEREEKRERGESVGLGEMEMVGMDFGRGSYGHHFDVDKVLSSLSEEQLFERVICGICRDFPIGAMQTDCGHIFCHDCLENYLHERTAQGDEYKTCPTCDRVFQTTKQVKRLRNVGEDEIDDGSGSSPSSSATGGGNKKTKLAQNSRGRDAMGFEPFTKETWITKSDNPSGDFPLAPSAKTTALKSILLKGFVEAPLDKVVIYVQFRALARIVGRICESEGWGFLYLTGDLSLDNRTKAIRNFREDPEIKILIAGLKCGGLGLNFPWANRCISLDLWWNHAVEQQAFGRIFRIGQEKDTYMTRIVVKNSIDMRLLSMQLHKLQNLEKAMHDGNERQKPNLSLKQLANLFGFLKTDADDNIISIEPDYVDDEPDLPEGGRAEVDRNILHEEF